MPIVRQTVTRMFGRFPAAGVNPDEAVALGAAVQAGLRARDAALREVVLTDVCPYTMGIETGVGRPDGSFQTGLFAPIIERNTLIPASREEMFHTVADNQALIKVRIFQGESRKVTDNIDLGSIDVDVPRAPAGDVQIAVRFTYDINGLLEVDVHVPDTDQRHNLVIFDRDHDEGTLDLEQQRATLAALKVHPRDMDANRTVLSRAARCYEQSLGPMRDHVARLMAAFEEVLDRQDAIEANHARVALAAALDAMEGDRFL